MPGLKSGRSVVEVGPRKDCIAWSANEPGWVPLPAEPSAPLPLPPLAVPMPEFCKKLARGDEEAPRRAPNGEFISGPAWLAPPLSGWPLAPNGLAGCSSSSSLNKLLIADIAGLRPASASGVRRSDGISGAEKRRPNPSGLLRRLANPVAAGPAWRSLIPAPLDLTSGLRNNETIDDEEDDLSIIGIIAADFFE